MFEKYKDTKEKRSHFGMSKKEHYKIMFMALITLGCLVVIVLQWGGPSTSKEGTPVEIPRGQRIQVPGGDLRAGSREARDRFDQLKDRLVRERAQPPGEGEKLVLPEIPKPPTPWEPDTEIWKQVDDAKIDQLEEQVILYALHQLNSMTQEEIKKKVEEDGYIPAADFIEHPEDFRGKFVSVTGTLQTMQNWVKSPNRSGVNQYWDGLLYNQHLDPSRRVYFYVFDKDREWLTQEQAMARKLTKIGELVTIHGIFIKLYRSTTEGGVVMVYPFIIGRKLEKARGITMRGQWQYSWPMLVFIGAGLSAVFIIFFFAMRRDRKSTDAFLHGRKYKKAGLVSNELARKVAAKGKGKEKGAQASAPAPPAQATPPAQQPEKPQGTPDEPGASPPSTGTESSP